MKGHLLLFFLSLAALFPSNNVYSQKILLSLEMEKRPIKDIIHTIEKHSQYVFFFSDEINQELEKTVDIRMKNQPIEKILDCLFASVDLSYAIKDRQINIFRVSRKIEVSRKQIPSPELIIYSGTVFDHTGEVLPGVNIRLDGSFAGITTDSVGCFSLKTREGAVAEFSYVGFLSKQVRFSKSKSYKIILYKDEKKINEIVVIGYGSVLKKDLTGSVTNVRLSDIKDVPVLSVDQALQGRIAGADIMSTTGEPGAITSIRIRGTRSITASNEPLLVVDGVMDGVNDLADINSSDIESITVLKDASATAIYGSRGSNGVIIITTKKGNKDKKSIILRADAGLSELPRKLDIMNASEFAQYRNDFALFSDFDNYGKIGLNTPQSEYPYPNPLIYGKGTDWVDEITRTAPYQNYQLSLSGGSSQSSYFASFSYNNTQGIIEKSGLERYTGRLNIDHKICSFIKTGLMLSCSFRDQDPNLVSIGGTSWWKSAIFLSPLLKANSNYNDLWYSGQKFNSPRAILDNNIYHTTKNMLNVSGYLETEPSKSWMLRTQGTYYVYDTHDYQFEPSTLPANLEDESDFVYRGESREESLLSETTVSYKHELEKVHHLDGMIGFTCQKWISNALAMQGNGFLSDATLWNNMNAIPDKENLTVSSDYGLRLKTSLLTRFDYNYAGCYYLTVTAREDGASNFAINNKWGFFPSAAFKWNIKNESFMKPFEWLGEMALRLSGGRTGNDGIGTYQSLAALSSTTNGYLFNGSQQVAFRPSRLASPDLTWEKTDLYNLGIDLSFFKERLRMTLEGYLSNTRDLLLSVQVPTQTGYDNKLINSGKTSNKGIELSLESANVSKRDFSWTSSFTISHNRQMVLDIGTTDFVSVYGAYGNNSYMMYGYVKGYPLNALWGFRYGGTWKSQEEITRNKITKGYVSSSNYQYSLGCARYMDVNHDGRLNEKDLVYLGNADPWIYGGLQNNFIFKNLSVSIFFNYSLGGKIYNISEQWMGNGSPYTNQYRYMLGAWHPVRSPNSDIPRAGSNDGIASDRMVYDASFLRLNNISLGYKLDVAERTRQIIRDVSLVLSGENLYLWKKYNGFDPDVSSKGTSSTLRRVDEGAYPKARTFVLSLQLKY